MSFTIQSASRMRESYGVCISFLSAILYNVPIAHFRALSTGVLLLASQERSMLDFSGSFDSSVLEV